MYYALKDDFKSIEILLLTGFYSNVIQLSSSIYDIRVRILCSKFINLIFKWDERNLLHSFISCGGLTALVCLLNCSYLEGKYK